MLQFGSMVLIRGAMHPASFPGSQRLLCSYFGLLKSHLLPCWLSNLLTPPTSPWPCPNSPVTHVSSLTSPSQWQPGSDWHRQPQVTGLETYHHQAACKDWEGQRSTFSHRSWLACSFLQHFHQLQQLSVTAKRGGYPSRCFSQEDLLVVYLHISAYNLFITVLSVTVWNWISHLMEYSVVVFQFGWSYRAFARQCVKAELWEDAANRGARCNATLVLTVN